MRVAFVFKVDLECWVVEPFFLSRSLIVRDGGFFFRRSLILMLLFLRRSLRS